MPSKVSAWGRGSRPKTCRICGVKASETVTMSARGLCPKHSAERATAANRQISNRNGPHYEEYKRGLRSFVKSLDLD